MIDYDWMERKTAAELSLHLQVCVDCQEAISREQACVSGRKLFLEWQTYIEGVIDIDALMAETAKRNMQSFFRKEG